jgi:ABC-2 type transport system ATP-binding protein
MNAVVAAVRAEHLGKKYGRRDALTDCTLSIPTGRVTGVVGPNGAGKSTLLGLAAGLTHPTSGTIETLGAAPAADPHHLARVGFVAQDAPVYPGLTVAEHLRLGAELNPGWDGAYARARIENLDLDSTQRAGKLSGGQRAQLALTIGLAKRPELLLLDEPVASLDPLARREFFSDLMAGVAETGMSVVLSSHVISDLERVCDHLVVLARAELRLAGDVDDLLAGHRRLTGTRRDPSTLPADQHVVAESHTDRQSTFIVRTDAPVLDPAWTVEELSLEDLVLTYLRQPAAGAAPAPLRSVS